MKTVVSVCSARPNFVKLAAVHHALQETARGECEHVIVHSGQHYDPLFSDVFFHELSISTPTFNLGIKGGDREQVIEATQAAFANILPKIRPDIVLVYGDVNGAVGAARAAKEAGVLLGHVEAGLRSFDLIMPEEHNRIAIDALSDLLFCSEESGMANLKREGVKGERHLVGNTMIDTLIRMQGAIKRAELPSGIPSRYAVVTLHRPSNVDDPAMLTKNLEFFLELSKKIPLLLPVHHRLKAKLESHPLHERITASLCLLPAQPYLPFLKLVTGARFILTDSGGIQEEAAFLQKRCFTLRKNTERPVTVESGSNILVDITEKQDRANVMEAAEGAEPYVTIPPLWDGKAGKRIVELLLKS